MLHLLLSAVATLLVFLGTAARPALAGQWTRWSWTPSRSEPTSSANRAVSMTPRGSTASGTRK